jgi:hypothetical protein
MRRPSASRHPDGAKAPAGIPLLASFGRSVTVQPPLTAFTSRGARLHGAPDNIDVVALVFAFIASR